MCFFYPRERVLKLFVGNSGFTNSCSLWLL
jgi:hypothetical protein